ncbi:MAG: hypothetical protein K6E84_03740 [Lachnospiraceae bacterium]|nr:hypothetical protein [Lachnospiraceae bacterium]
MGKGLIRLTRVAPFFLLPALLLSGCGHVKSAKKLIRAARAEHGSCEVVSKTESEDRVEVVLKDKLQGFEYTVYSYMQDLNIDGSSFGSLPETRDHFDEALREYVYAQTAAEFSELTRRTGAVLKDNYVLSVPETADAAAVGEEASRILQKQNLNNRMDRCRLDIETEKREHLGSCVLPECSFRDPVQEKDDYFINEAPEYITGLNPSDITYDRKETIGDITYYYFKTQNQNFWISNEEDKSTGLWKTNFDKTKDKITKPIHFHLHFSTH